MLQERGDGEEHMSNFTMARPVPCRTPDGDPLANGVFSERCPRQIGPPAEASLAYASQTSRCSLLDASDTDVQLARIVALRLAAFARPSTRHCGRCPPIRLILPAGYLHAAVKRRTATHRPAFLHREKETSASYGAGKGSCVSHLGVSLLCLSPRPPPLRANIGR